MARSLRYRLLAVLTTLLLGLGWGAPVAHAACGAVGSTVLDRCGSADSAEHCESDRAPTSAVCLTHHASQEALTGPSAAPDIQGGGSVGAKNGPAVPSVGTSVSIRQSNRHAVSRVGRLHLRVGVWLE